MRVGDERHDSGKRHGIGGRVEQQECRWLMQATTRSSGTRRRRDLSLFHPLFRFNACDLVYVLTEGEENCWDERNCVSLSGGNGNDTVMKSERRSHRRPDDESV